MRENTGFNGAYPKAPSQEFARIEPLRHRSGSMRYWTMATEGLANVPMVTRFVREVVGRNRPDEVFQRVEVRRGSIAAKSGPADYELRMGSRLLVVVTSELVEGLSCFRLEQVIWEGKRARNTGEFNRFRLVVQALNVTQDTEKLLRSFEGVSGKDEKTHAQVVGRSEVPDFFSGI